MADIWYGERAAIDPTTVRPMNNVDVQFYAPTDTAFTAPLTVKDSSGVATTSVHVQNYILPGFYGPDTGVVARSGNWITPLVGDSGAAALAQAEAAVADAATALATATGFADQIDGVTNALGVIAMTPDTFGAVGNGVTSDSTAIQACINALSAAGGGMFLFSPGKSYVINTAVEIKSNITFRGPGAIITRTASPTAVAMFGLSHGATGYGSGVTNVRFEQCYFRGDFASNVQFNFEWHHASRIVYDQCTFEQCQIGGHIFDCGGCEQMTWRDCTFYGRMMPADTAYIGTEMIQMDVSLAGSMSYADDAGSYDGLYSRRFTVDGCKFLPITVGGTTYPSVACMIGSHTEWEGHYYYDVTIRDTIVVDPQHDDISTPTDATRGLIHFEDVRRLTIENVKVITSQPTNQAIVKITNSTSGRYVDSDPNLLVGDVPTGTWTQPNQSREIKISKLTVDGFTQVSGSAQPKPAVVIIGRTNMPVYGVSIRDSSIINGYKPLRIEYTDMVTMEGNNYDNNASTPSYTLGTSRKHQAGNSTNPMETVGSAAPSSGTWAVGDRCWNASPAVGSPAGWICVVAGSPGTWAKLPNLAA